MKSSGVDYSSIMRTEAILCVLTVVLGCNTFWASHVPGGISRREVQWNASETDKCTSFRGYGGSIEIQCYGNGTVEKNYTEMYDTSPRQIILNAVVKPGQTVEIQCSSKTEWGDLNLISGLVVGNCPSVHFRFCPLPSSNSSSGLSSFKRFFTLIGARNVSILHFESHLSLTDNLLSTHLEGLTEVKKLIFSNNGLTTLPEDLFSALPQVNSIDLRGNNIHIPSTIFQRLVHLEILEMGNNKIASLPQDVFRNLSSLRLLNLWGNRLGESNFSAGNSMKTFSRSHLRDLTSLESLDLSRNGLKILNPDIFYDLISLKNLNLNSNNFTSLPGGLFMRNIHLEKLRLNYNNGPLRTLPQGLFANLTSLRELSLDSCGLEWVSSDLFEGSVYLINISVRRNKFKVLPVGLFFGLNKLETLDLSDNHLASLPESLLSGLHAIKVVRLRKNQLEALPMNLLYDLTNLKELDLSSNKLKDLPEQMFVNSKSLHKLFVSHNQLTFPTPLMDSLGPTSPFHHCSELRVLDVSNNSLTAIFSDWRLSMLNLSVLNLSYNSISEISVDDLQFLTEKATVNLTHNKISSINLKGAKILAKPQPNYTKRMVSISLNNNPLNCDCNIYDLLLYVEGRIEPQVMEFVDLEVGDLLCQTPENLAGKSVTSLKSYELTCDLGNLGFPHASPEDNEKLEWIFNDTKKALDLAGDKCPTYCRCLYRPMDLSLIVNCTGTNITTFPRALPVLNSTNYTELQAEGLGLEKLWAVESLPIGYDRVKVLKLGKNYLSNIDASSLPSDLSILELQQNNLTHLGKNVLKILSHARVITLHDNPWQCDCDAIDLLNFLQENFKKVKFLSNVTCSAGHHNWKIFSQLTADDLCPLPTAVIIAVCLVMSIVAITLGTLAALYYRHQHSIKVWLYAHRLCLWLIAEDELDKDKKYDAFISYSHKDEDFVVGELLPGLEGGKAHDLGVSGENGITFSPGESKKDVPQYKLCLHFRDWIAGEWIPAQIARSVEESRRTIVVLSPAFLESVWGQMEFRTAHCRALSEGRTRIIVILYGEVPPTDTLDPELRTYLSTNTYVKWGDPWFWQKLRYALPHLPRKGKKSTPASSTDFCMTGKMLENGNGPC